MIRKRRFSSLCKCVAREGDKQIIESQWKEGNKDICYGHSFQTMKRKKEVVKTTKINAYTPGEKERTDNEIREQRNTHTKSSMNRRHRKGRKSLWHSWNHSKQERGSLKLSKWIFHWHVNKLADFKEKAGKAEEVICADSHFRIQFYVFGRGCLEN